MFLWSVRCAEIGRNDESDEQFFVVFFHLLLLHFVVDHVDMGGTHFELGVTMVPSQEIHAFRLDFLDLFLCGSGVHLHILRVVNVLATLWKLTRYARYCLLDDNDIFLLLRFDSMPTSEPYDFVSVNMRMTIHKNQRFQSYEYCGWLLCLIQESLALHQFILVPCRIGIIRMHRRQIHLDLSILCCLSLRPRRLSRRWHLLLVLFAFGPNVVLLFLRCMLTLSPWILTAKFPKI